MGRICSIPTQNNFWEIPKIYSLGGELLLGIMNQYELKILKYMKYRGTRSFITIIWMR